MNVADYLIVTFFSIGLFLVITILVVLAALFVYDRLQIRHSVLRNYPIIGQARYFMEKIGPEVRQYLFDSDTESRPFSRVEFEHIVKSAKYLRNIIGFGSQRDFEEPGYYIRNAMFPRQMEEMKMDRGKTVSTKKYILLKDTLFTRKEKWENDRTSAYLLHDDDAVVIGENVPHPFVLKGQIGMSAMSYGSLGERAITALSEGLGIARGTWMNTGEGGISPYHLKGDVDLIMQIGPGLFGVRDREGNFSWDELKRKSELPQVKAFELKLGQGAKMRGGHIDGEKVTPEIAKIRMVKPYRSIDSPNRFKEFDDYSSMFAFIERIRELTGKPVGIKIVVGGEEEADALAQYMKQSGSGPDFITVDGGEGGTGASFQELADSVGLPIKSALTLMQGALRKHGVRQRVKLIASGKLFTPDRIAVALGMGADLVSIARGFMITVGCIQALKCHSNECPVGVATTDSHLQKALVVDEKKYRVANYVITLREGLYRIAAAAGIESPVHFSPELVVFKERTNRVTTLKQLFPEIYE